MNREALTAKLVRIFSHEDFDKKESFSTICGPMPDYEGYMKQREAQRRAGAKTEMDCMKPCYDEPLLTRDQEQHLFRLYNFCKHRSKLALDSNKLSSAREWYSRTEKPLRILTGANVRLAIPYVKKYRSPNHFEDLVSESYYLTCRAVDYFDWRRGLKFSTYCTWVIVRTLSRTASIYFQNDARYNGMDDILADSIPARPNDAEDDFAHASEVLADVLRFADPRERKILKLRFLQGMTLEEVGRAMGVTKERVRQLQTRGLQRIREALERKDLYPELRVEAA